ncbi:MAG: hypothetical protein V4669_13605 [Pseudomonadota bacterium]
MAKVTTKRACAQKQEDPVKVGDLAMFAATRLNGGKLVRVIRPYVSGEELDGLIYNDSRSWVIRSLGTPFDYPVADKGDGVLWRSPMEVAVRASDIRILRAKEEMTLADALGVLAEVIERSDSVQREMIGAMLASLVQSPERCSRITELLTRVLSPLQAEAH